MKRSLAIVLWLQRQKPLTLLGLCRVCLFGFCNCCILGESCFMGTWRVDLSFLDKAEHGSSNISGCFGQGWEQAGGWREIPSRLTWELKGHVLSWSLSHSHRGCFCSAGLFQEREGASGDGTESRSPAGVGTLPDTQSPFPPCSERDGEGTWAVLWRGPVPLHHTRRCLCPLKDSNLSRLCCSSQQWDQGKLCPGPGAFPSL